MKKLSIVIFSCLSVHGIIFTKSEADTLHNFFLANYHQSRGQHEKAKKGYERLLRSPDTPIHVYKGYLPLLWAHKEYRQIVALMPRLQEQFKNDPDIQLIFAQALEMSGKQKEADELYIKLSRQFKSHQEIIYQAVNSYRRNKERDNAIQLIDDLLNSSPRKPNNFIFHFIKAQLYAEMSNAPSARDSVNKSIELYPHFDKSWLLFGMIEEKEGKLDDAIKGYTNFLELSGTSNQQLEKHLLELLIKRRMTDTKQKAMAVDNKCLLEGLSLFQKREYRKGLDSINKCLEKEPDNKDATIIKINMLSALGKHRKAAHVLAECIKHDPYNDMWYMQLHALCLNGLSHRRAIKTLHKVEHECPNAPLVHIHLAELHHQHGKLHKTIFHYQRALDHINDTTITTQIMYNLACLHAETNHYERMVSLLETIMKQSPDFMPARHLRAYHYLVYEDDITHAQELLDEVLTNDPCNIQYRLTQAHLLHTQGEYQRALELLGQTRIFTSHHALIDKEYAEIARDYMKHEI